MNLYAPGWEKKAGSAGSQESEQLLRAIIPGSKSPQKDESSTELGIWKGPLLQTTRSTSLTVGCPRPTFYEDLSGGKWELPWGRRDILRKPQTLLLLTLFLEVVMCGNCTRLLTIYNLNLPRQSPQVETLLYVLASSFVPKTLSSLSGVSDQWTGD